MAEPEELILEGAHFATRVARDAWRRYGTSSRMPRSPLAGVRARLEMFLTALFGTSDSGGAHGAAGASELALARSRAGARTSRGDEPLLSGTDGRRVYLPPALPSTTGGQDATESLPPPRRGTGRAAGASARRRCSPG